MILAALSENNNNNNKKATLGCKEMSVHQVKFCQDRLIVFSDSLCPLPLPQTQHEHQPSQSSSFLWVGCVIWEEVKGSKDTHKEEENRDLHFLKLSLTLIGKEFLKKSKCPAQEVTLHHMANNQLCAGQGLVFPFCG